MKITSIIVVTLFTFLSAAAVTVTAQLPRDQAEADRKNSPDKKIRLLPKPPQTDKKKNKGKKPAVKTASEYKFERIDHKPAYTFDKKTNPIIKEPKPKKKAVKKPIPAKTAAKPAPKKQTANPDGEAEQKEEGPVYTDGNSTQTTQGQPEE